jgi:hypothetical protein
LKFENLYLTWRFRIGLLSFFGTDGKSGVDELFKFIFQNLLFSTFRTLPLAGLSLLGKILFVPS